MTTEVASHARSGGQPITNDAVLDIFRQEACLDVRKLAGQLHVDSRDKTLIMAIANLRKAGKLRRIGGKGHHAIFVRSTYEA